MVRLGTFSEWERPEGSKDPERRDGARVATSAKRSECDAGVRVGHAGGRGHVGTWDTLEGGATSGEGSDLRTRNEEVVRGSSLEIQSVRVVVVVPYFRVGTCVTGSKRHGCFRSTTHRLTAFAMTQMPDLFIIPC